MDKVSDIIDFLEMLYPDSGVPCCLLDADGCLLSACPEWMESFPIPEKYTGRLLDSPEHISYLSTAYGVYFGCVRAALSAQDNSRSLSGADFCGCYYLIFGPVNLTPYSESELHRLFDDYGVRQEAQSSLRSFFRMVPQFSLNSFLQKLVFINYCVNQEKRSVKDVLPAVLSDDVAVTAQSTEKLYEQKSAEEHNNSHELETVLMELVRTGRPDSFQDIMINESGLHAGITGPTSLRQLKNNIIITTTLSTRAAIEGGLDSDTAFQLSDTFIQTAEQISDPDALNELMGKIVYTFARRVQEVQTPVTSDSIIMKAVRYIQKNTASHITVSDVARYMGFSRSYLSSYFKNELGFSIGDFITRCKMEEARQLLRYTDRPVSSISSCLCFSSQSHFQTAFKHKYGVTPLQYRREAQKEGLRKAES